MSVVGVFGISSCELTNSVEDDAKWIVSYFVDVYSWALTLPELLTLMQNARDYVFSDHVAESLQPSLKYVKGFFAITEESECGANPVQWMLAIVRRRSGPKISTPSLATRAKPQIPKPPLDRLAMDRDQASSPAPGAQEEQTQKSSEGSD
ncbi:uncharacterized protein LY89DRAFT_729861 [Mollisia scopiformis]|uniref:Uncharacterized protein n=1 Tax=Mollisia scopiformis TaxID=149040 RepID=A0A194XLE2_MOLSC|nr:uncharacterized protein LY89DRAFT_729861 [Mollisia scopiformis]KUJ21060.1 hypothetical protein LY89DRAFT_729861 [Mollisia scopiformis]